MLLNRVAETCGWHVAAQCLPKELAVDATPRIINPGMRISDETLNLSFSPVLHTDIYRFALSIETGIETANFKSIFPIRNRL